MGLGLGLGSALGARGDKTNIARGITRGELSGRVQELASSLSSRSTRGAFPETKTARQVTWSVKTRETRRTSPEG